jgi:hypothetical protein
MKNACGINGNACFLHCFCEGAHHLWLFYANEIDLRFAQDNLDVKKVSVPSKNPTKRLIMCFSRLKKHKIPHF